MKKKLLKRLSSLVFALAMVLSAGAILSSSKGQNHPEIVLAEDEEKPEVDSDETEDKDEETPTESETPTTTTSETPAEPTSSGSEEITAKPAPSVEAKDIFKLIAKAFRDALRDLLAHFKKWFKL